MQCDNHYGPAKCAGCALEESCAALDEILRIGLDKVLNTEI